MKRELSWSYYTKIHAFKDSVPRLVKILKYSWSMNYVVTIHKEFVLGSDLLAHNKMQGI